MKHEGIEIEDKSEIRNVVDWVLIAIAIVVAAGGWLGTVGVKNVIWILPGLSVALAQIDLV